MTLSRGRQIVSLSSNRLLTYFDSETNFPQHKYFVPYFHVIKPRLHNIKLKPENVSQNAWFSIVCTKISRAGEMTRYFSITWRSAILCGQFCSFNSVYTATLWEREREREREGERERERESPWGHWYNYYEAQFSTRLIVYLLLLKWTEWI